MQLPLFLLFASTFLSVGQAKIYEDVSDIPGFDYDFVIVGGGAAGNVVANRLTENPKFSVLLLEAGVSNEGVIDSIVPFFEWNYTTVPQVGLNNRSVPYQRAHILGGCTAHNGMIYTRGSADDYDRYAAMTGDPGWSWNNMLPYFFKNEKWTPPVDHHDTNGQFDPAVHSTHGINSVSLNGFQWPIFQQHVQQATKELPEDFPFNLDFNSGKMLGVGYLQSTIGGGERSSSATSYLAPKFAGRPNLSVLLHAQVSKLVNPSKTNKGEINFGGVQFLPSGSLYTAKAKKEIILSAGSVGTPMILMHSGVGDQAALKALGIPSVLHLPSVGQNATDHPFFNGGTWLVNSTQTVDSIEQNATRFNEAYAQWNKSHSSPFSALPLTHLGWSRLDVNSVIFEKVQDPAAGPNAPHIEMGMGTGPGGPTSAPGHYMQLGMAVLTPTSRGSVTLQSNNPFDPPLIDLGFFTTEFDIFTARQAIQHAAKFVSASTWKDYIIAPTMDLANLSTDALDQYIRNTTDVSWHLVSTASMSAWNATYGVVNPDLLVKGASGLRVIDASILPFIPTGHTQAASYVVGERGADLVKQAWE
ncbi:aryl-alcohol-oxidase from pleurotus Eryingii [Roridomyces roridus]|uniref:Aryl-alcohol-oxidase from pleurotus Eryingii n=1 Tax=Roridomyces roridus TaxID=1738132 RepID=A0AAD7FXY1_9AGAR|nr:aryl-alcohol-oxidase from pleurotus Eryingii [Roridomyces roridus]